MYYIDKYGMCGCEREGKHHFRLNPLPPSPLRVLARRRWRKFDDDFKIKECNSGENNFNKSLIRHSFSFSFMLSNYALECDS
jgi:hypothetical protein